MTIDGFPLPARIQLTRSDCSRGGALSDRVGRNYAVVFAGFWGILGQSLEASAQNASWMLCARVLGQSYGAVNVLLRLADDLCQCSWCRHRWDQRCHTRLVFRARCA